MRVGRFRIRDSSAATAGRLARRGRPSASTPSWREQIGERVGCGVTFGFDRLIGSLTCVAAMCEEAGPALVAVDDDSALVKHLDQEQGTRAHPP
jgi:hypothetical protein